LLGEIRRLAQQLFEEARLRRRQAAEHVALDHLFLLDDLGIHARCGLP